MKIGTFSFFVPSLGPGNKTMVSNIIFDIFKEEDQYFSAVPLLNEAELRIAHMPASLFFRIEKGNPVSRSAERSGHTELLRVIVYKLKEVHVIL